MKGKYTGEGGGQKNKTKKGGPNNPKTNGD